MIVSDEVWVSLTSKGLLKRALRGVADATVTCVGDEYQVSHPNFEVTVTCPDVTVGPGAIAAARCTCPAAGVCQHIIIVGLWLRDHQNTNAAVPDVHAEVMGLTPEVCVAFGGVRQWRAAVDFVHSVPGPLPVASTGADGSPELAVAAFGVRVVFAPGGLASVVTVPRVVEAERWAIAGVLWYQAAHGMPLPEPVVTQVVSERAASVAALLPQVTDQVVAVVRTGTVHISAAVVAEVAALGTWARGVQLPVLYRALGRVEGQLTAVLRRSATADPVALVHALARVYGVAAALAEVGVASRAVVGSARAEYVTVSSLELVAVGGRSWQSASGFVGLTCVFWSSAQQRFVTWTTARPTDSGFVNPEVLWGASGPWSGVSPSMLPGRRVLVKGARVSANGRVSGGVDSAASESAVSVEPQWPVCGDFAELPALVQQPGQAWFAPQRAPGQWVVVRVARWEAPVFDDVEQQLLWVVFDDRGRSLSLTVRFSAVNQAAIGLLERTVAQLRPGPVDVVAFLNVRAGVVSGEPLALWPAGGFAAASADVSGAFVGLHTPVVATKPGPGVPDTEATDSVASDSVAVDSVASDGAESFGDEESSEWGAGGVVLQSHVQWLRAVIECGVPTARADAVSAELVRRHAALVAAGYTVFGQLRDAPVAEVVLRSAVVTFQLTTSDS